MVSSRPLLLVCIAVLGTLSARTDEPFPLRGKPWTQHVIDNQGQGADGTKLFDINGDSLPDIVTGWEEHGETRLYLHPGTHDAVRQPWPTVTVGRTPDSEDAIFADLDRDGRADVVAASEGRTDRVFVHWGPKPSEALLDPNAWRQTEFPAVAGLGGWIHLAPVQFDGLHGVDLILGSRPGPRKPAASIGWLEAPADARDMAAWKWHPLSPAGWIMSIEIVDMNGDGRADILYSDRTGPTRGIHWFENPGAEAVRAGVAPRRHSLPTPDLTDAVFLAVGDVDRDGRDDIVAGVQVAPMDPERPDASSRLLWLRRDSADGLAWTQHLLPVPLNTGSIKAVAIGDIDGDGRPDLVATSAHAHGARRGVFWLQQGETTTPRDWTAHDISGADGIKFDLVRLLDLDGDGDLDVLTNEELEAGRGLGVIWYENPRLDRK